MENFYKADFRNKNEMIRDELELQKRIFSLGKLVEELVGRLHYVHAKAEAIQAARFVPFSKVSRLARKSLPEILVATTVATPFEPATDKKT
jgi:hypothetical protein